MGPRRLQPAAVPALSVVQRIVDGLRPDHESERREKTASEEDTPGLDGARDRQARYILCAERGRKAANVLVPEHGAAQAARGRLCPA